MSVHRENSYPSANTRITKLISFSFDHPVQKPCCSLDTIFLDPIILGQLDLHTKLFNGILDKEIIAYWTKNIAKLSPVPA